MKAPMKVLLVCSAISIASTTGTDKTPDNNQTAPINFPVFFRSRFNPRTLQQNERLIPAFDDSDLRLLLRPHTTASSFTTPQSSQRVDQLTTEAVPESLEQEPECGDLPPGADGFPWVAVLEHAGPQQGSPRKRTLSKGVLIDRQHVLTTVSSVHNSHPTWVVTSVRLGDVPTRRHSTHAGNSSQRANGTQRYEIETVFLHESKDIALIRLANGGVQQLTDSVRPICVPREDYRLESFKISSHVCQRSQVVSTATGRHGSRVSRSKLQPLDLISGDACNQLLRPHGARLPVKSFCARESAEDNCTGSLGGPAVATVRGRYHVLGLRSYLQTETTVEGLDIPSIYVRVGGLRKWISAVIKAIGE
ncbi:AGAP000182-PA [Anopheles gambiae str. PEST]|uniref:AGAP000182-PA n=1 Tax=Anopheles gambiae TaxID=7165 RepID=Q7QEW5_ANOGA|nr:AGAP000182-PA [Anopheles gambiae str. PEST]